MLDRGGGPSPEDSRNMIIALVLIMAMLVGYEFFYAGPQRARLMQQQAAMAQQQQQQAAAAAQTPGAQPLPETREEALNQTAAGRISIETPSVDGSISLAGARIDDLNLRNYRRTLEADSPEVTLMSPVEAPRGSDAVFGWQDENLREPLVGEHQVWTQTDSNALTPQTPVVLTLKTADGLEVTRTISIDANYMFTVTDDVRNTGRETRKVRPFGVVRRIDKPEDYKLQGVVHQGLVGVFGPTPALREERFEAADKFAIKRQKGEVGEDQVIEQVQSQGGWLGITDHYWMTAMVIDASEKVSATYNARIDNGHTDYRAYYLGDWRDVPAGGSISYTQRLFAGAKRVDLLQEYQHAFTIPMFDKAVDWGKLEPLTRLFFSMLDFFGKKLGAFALAILVMTVVVKLVMFPLVYQSFKSMAKMRALQPKMKDLQERYAADKQRMQQEQMKLFQAEKVNPLAGCLPLLLQLPVFFALYKTLTVTIEMRHAPFFGWIHDLSAKDPTTIFNLFGLLPFDPTHFPIIGGFLAIGVWPILNGVTMWGLQSLSPPPTDPTQAKVFQFLPILYTFFFSSLAAGLVIYYTWSNLLTVVQQYVIMRRQGVETQLDIFLKKYLRKQETAPAE